MWTIIIRMLIKMVGGALLKRYGKQIYEKLLQKKLRKYWDKVNPFSKKKKEEKKD
ncbi:hypothetical protein LCGC14_1315240 [marine sediment metagenome]|uniref:Uncharacterized protein n=1 Tax=marine sediment metagenome TaxID=412755 RepID=A0A0F9N223_9ZZZZ